MKNRSHRHPVSDPLDDWVDGSWTVDCVCGVNFDDGEEMVNCDECGVWVHTRCSRYVKSEKSFACDKCKSKNSRNVEETEVAQLLVELPTKTLRMDNPNPPSGSGPPRRPFRLWTDIPMEDRVHVQGVPGGDPALFGGFSSVFSPELWKCTGYVPKKLNFQFREFPCWDEKQDYDKKSDEEHENPTKRTAAEHENPANKGAGVLFSLSKENVLPTPVATLVDMKRQVEGECDRLTPSNGTKKREREDINVRRPQNGVKKDRSLHQPIVIYSGKRKKEVSETSKDRSGKKKARGVDKEGDSKKRGADASKSVSTFSSDAKQLEFYEDSATKVVKIVTQSSKHGNSRGTVSADSLSDGYRVSDNDAGNHRKNLIFSGQHLETSSFGVSRHNSSIEVRPIEDNARHQVSARLETSSKTDDGVSSLLEYNDSGSVPIKEEVPVDDLDNLYDTGGGSNRNEGIDPHKSEPLVEDLGTTAPEVKDYQNFQASNGDRSSSSLLPNFEVKAVDIDNFGGVCNVLSSLPSDVKLDSMEPLAQHPGISVDHLSENVKVVDSAVASLQCSDHKVEDVDKSTVVSDCQTGKADESPGDPCQPMQQLLGSESSMVVRKSSSDVKRGSRLAEEPSKSGSKILGPPVTPSQRKMVVSIGKSSSTSSTFAISKPSVSDIRMPANLQNHSSSTKRKKNNAPTDVVRNEDGRERAKKLAKELPKSSFSSVLKTPHSSKFPHASVSKRTLSDPNESVICSSKTSSVQKNAATPDTGESASSLQTECVLHVQNKITASGLQQRGEKINLPNCQPSSKVNHAPPTNPPAPSNSLATLSDEELALLLHQELNSSPRVPRVPRMRHAGSLPQLASPTATSMLMKRTSSSGGKDHGLVSKRKNKDLAKDGLRNSREFDDEAKKVDRVPSLPDHSRQDLDPVTKVEADSRSGKGSHSVSRSIPPTTTVSSGPSSSTEANEQNMSSTRNASDDDTGTVGRPTHRTLPGLIAEIMSKGKRMTYEELCNAVLPHWPNLRKHNGERYAYSSHSQAVLDCLRNRSEWAQLVDRGPKTNASRKRRKLDAEPSSFESEGNEYSKDRSAKDVESKSFESHRDEFPKGKRKARKRRRLALQGRGIKDVRRRHKADVLSDDDIDSFSNSTEETVFSEDEILGGGGVCSVGCEASASSDETGTML